MKNNYYYNPRSLSLLLCGAFSGSVLVLSSPTAKAQSGEYLGVQTNVETYANDFGGWRSVGTPKNYDPDGDQILGTDGYQLFSTPTSSLPSYVAGLSQVAGVSDFSGGGYAQVDDPAGGSDIQSGIFYINGVPGGESRDMFNFLLTGEVPSTFTIHLMAGSSDNTTTTQNELFILRLNETSLASAVLDSSSSLEDGPDWYSFEITGAQPGDLVTLSMFNNSENDHNFEIGGIAFDSIPEPMISIQAVVVGTLLLMRRKRA